MTNFQVILLVIFGAFIVVGVVFFSLYRGSSKASDVTVTVWGDISSFEFSTLLNNPSFNQDQSIATTRYVEKSSKTIETEFTEALARGIGPDLIILSQDKLWQNRPKLLAIPYTSISEGDFKSTFVEEGELFLSPDGIYGLPVSVDPMVLYFNRDLLSAASIAQPTAFWDEIYSAALNLSKIDVAGNLIASTIALGEARNIPHAKDIISLLLLQAGTPITGYVGNNLKAQISYNPNLPVSPGESAFDFYTQFSNPTKAFYSWNRSQIDAQTHFTSGDSAYYLGFASEYKILKNKNPLLNFGVALVPQSRVAGKVVTFGRLQAVAISRGSLNPNAALVVARKLASSEIALPLSQIQGLPPARRDLLSSKPSDANNAIFYSAALQAKGWLDPDPVATDVIFREAIESITSGRARTFEAVNETNKKVEALIK